MRGGRWKWTCISLAPSPGGAFVAAGLSRPGERRVGPLTRRRLCRRRPLDGLGRGVLAPSPGGAFVAAGLSTARAEACFAPSPGGAFVAAGLSRPGQRRVGPPHPAAPLSPPASRRPGQRRVLPPHPASLNGWPASPLAGEADRFIRPKCFRDLSRTGGHSASCQRGAFLPSIGGCPPNSP